MLNAKTTILTSARAQAHGHQQVLWLHEDKVLEVGSSNIFFIFKDKSGI